MQDENQNTQPVDQNENNPETPTVQPAVGTTPPPSAPAAPEVPVENQTVSAASNVTTEADVSSSSENTASTQEPSVEEKPKKEGGILSFIVTLLVAFALVQVINMFFFQSYKVFGSSMFSTLHDGDRLIISKVGRTGSKITKKHYIPKRGEIIVFVDPQNPSIQLIKRVIGLPGERVVVKDEKITVYNKEHPEGFNPDDAEYGKNLPPTSGEKDVIVPDNQIFVSGDNREGSNSLDSRNELGTVPDSDIIGTLKIRIFPFNTAKFF